MYKGNGTFISIYDEDALIFNLLFGYKILPELKCGFPNTALEKVLNHLEINKISYKIMYNNQIMKEYNQNDNQYEKILLLAKKSSSVNKRIDLLLKNIKLANPEKLEKIIESIEQCLK